MTTWNDFYESLDGNGWFRREGMICAPVHVLADSLAPVRPAAEIGPKAKHLNDGEARESMGNELPGECMERKLAQPDSRGGRTIICGDSNTERGTCQPECASCPVTSPVPTGRGNSAVSELPQCRVSWQVQPVAVDLKAIKRTARTFQCFIWK